MSTNKPFLVAGNWKLNKGPEESKQFVKTLKETVKPEEESHLILLPSALSAFAVQESLGKSEIRWGGQNCYAGNTGAFTGENSPEVLSQMGAKFCLAGHSERRQIFMESDELIAKKVKAIQAQNLTPILCVGESLDDRKWGRTLEVIRRQLRSGLENLDSAKKFVVAYEPIWAIGTGEVATPDQVDEVHLQIRKELENLLSGVGTTAPILYGGSVKSSNCEVLSQLPQVNGFLVGGASLDAKEFVSILRNSLSPSQIRSSI